MTGLPVEQRFENHKKGQKSAWVVKKYGLRLMPELYGFLNPMPFEAAAQMEKVEFLPNARGLRTSFFPSERRCQPTVPLRLSRLRLGLFELSIGLDQLCLTLRKLRFRLLKARFGFCQCHSEVSRI